MSLSEAVELTPDLSEQAWEQWGVDAADRPNVLVYAGEGIQGHRLVVFQDRLGSTFSTPNPATGTSDGCFSDHTIGAAMLLSGHIRSVRWELSVIETGNFQ